MKFHVPDSSNMKKEPVWIFFEKNYEERLADKGSQKHPTRILYGSKFSTSYLTTVSNEKELNCSSVAERIMIKA